MEENKQASLLSIFGIFAKIGAFTIGGGYAMIPIIEAEMTKRKWIPEDELDDVVVLAQSAPGLLAVNMAIFTGYKLRGLKGSIVATIGAVLPSFVIILLIAMFFTAFKENPIIRRIFQGLRPVAIALILVPAVNMAKKSPRKWWSYTLMAVTVFLVAFLHVSAVWIILTVLVCSLGIAMINEGRKEKSSVAQAGGPKGEGRSMTERSLENEGRSAMENSRESEKNTLTENSTGKDTENSLGKDTENSQAQKGGQEQ